MNTVEKLFKYQTALQKWKTELDYRAKLEGKDLKNWNKKPLGDMPTPNLFELASDDAYAMKIKERIIGKVIKTPPPRRQPTQNV